MKLLPPLRVALGLSLVLALGAPLAGCRTRPKVDWAGRVGAYTYDQAILELGPPEREARLQDGTRVCEWVTQRARASSLVVGATGWGWGYGWYPGPVVVDTYAPEYSIRLTFGPDDRLTAWKKIVK